MKKRNMLIGCFVVLMLIASRVLSVSLRSGRRDTQVPVKA
jgi:hypothetical protein